MSGVQTVALVRHFSTMFSNVERRSRRDNSGTSDPRMIFKSSLQDLFVDLVNGSRVFEVKATDDSLSSLLFFISELYLDDNTHSVVAYGHVICLSEKNPRTLSLLEARCQEAVKLVVGKEAMEIWESSLPSMAERCGDIKHESNCVYGNGIARGPDKEQEGQVCSCRWAAAVAGMRVGDRRHAIPGVPMAVSRTPVAISPVFILPYLVATDGGLEDDENLARETAELNINAARLTTRVQPAQSAAQTTTRPATRPNTQPNTRSTARPNPQSPVGATPRLTMPIPNRADYATEEEYARAASIFIARNGMPNWSPPSTSSQTGRETTGTAAGTTRAQPGQRIVQQARDDNKCWKCGKVRPLKKCVKCGEARYCSKECQTQDWKEHQKTCGKSSSLNR
jgi:hypothetical protein